MDRLMRNPLLTDLTLEETIQYTADFIKIAGLPNMYIDKIETIEIQDYRGMLPCDLVAVNQVRFHKTGICLRAMTNNFNGYPVKEHHCFREEPSFKTQGRVIYASQKCAELDISYKAMVLDEEGYPMLPDDSRFLKALELYIKCEKFTILFELGKISAAALQTAKQDYSFRVGQCINAFTIPSVSEMESITNMLNQLVPRTNEFKKGFRNLGDKEYIKVN